MKPTLSIVVSMYNSSLYTIEVIEKLFFPSLLHNASREYELIIIDDLSPLQQETDALMSRYQPLLAAAFGNVVFRRLEKNHGFAGAYNYGASCASGDYLLVVNDDVYFPHNSIRSLFSVIQTNTTIGVVGPVTNVANTYQRTNLFTRLCDYSVTERNRIEQFATELHTAMRGVVIDFSNTSGPIAFCIILRRADFQDISGFDTRYRYGMFEDVDLNMKIYRRGLRRVLAADVFVEHGGSRGAHATVLSRPIRAVVAFTVNGCRFIWKWRSWVIIVHIVRSIFQEYGIGTITRELRRRGVRASLPRA